MPKCPRCGNELRYVPQSNNWYCDFCKYYPFAASQANQNTAYNKPVISPTSEVGAGDWIAGLGLILFFLSVLLLLSEQSQYGVWLLPISVTAMIAGAAIMAYEKSQRQASNTRTPNQTIYVTPLPASVPVQSTPSVNDRLVELERLRTANLITVEEYESRRRKILDEL